MKKVFFNYQAVKPIKKIGFKDGKYYEKEKRQIVMGCVEALDLGKQKENFKKRGFKDFQYWMDEKEEK